MFCRKNISEKVLFYESLFSILDSPVKPTSKVESSKDKKRKSPDDQDLFADDDEFESMMQDIDFDEEMGTFRFCKLVVEIKLVRIL
jgi:hypothetical protein